MKKNIFKKKMIVDCTLKIENFHSGQVAIIVMLVSVLMITVGLSLSKKTTVETKIDFNEEALKKAFNAAESGIDYYLATGNKAYSSTDELSAASVSTENIGGEKVLNFNEFTPANGVQFFWLVDHELNGEIGDNYYIGTFKVCADSFTGSMEINRYYYLSGTTYGVERFGYNFSSTQEVNGFTSVVESCITPISSEGNTILVTVTPIFAGANIYLNGSSVFPLQGERINSTGSAGVVFGQSGEETKINKKLSIERRYKIPSFLLSGIVSESSVLSQ
jgi:hypothetical protein